jgi:hypothetical protein
LHAVVNVVGQWPEQVEHRLCHLKQRRQVVGHDALGRFQGFTAEPSPMDEKRALTIERGFGRVGPHGHDRKVVRGSLVDGNKRCQELAKGRVVWS